MLRIIISTRNVELLRRERENFENLKILKKIINYKKNN